MSICNQSAPALMTFSHSSPNFEKSQAKMEGAIMGFMLFEPCFISKNVKMYVVFSFGYFADFTNN